MREIELRGGEPLTIHRWHSAEFLQRMMSKQEERNMADEQASLGRRFWIGFQKCFRGLVAEEKGEHGWELSLQRVAFWVVLGHCLTIWSKLDHLATDAATKMDVSPGELNTLWALLAYGGVKIGAEAAKSMTETWKGDGAK